MIYDLGIDVGTSYTAAAVRRPDGVVEVVGLGPIADNIPTVLYLGDDGTLIVGDAANRRSVIDPAGAAREFKRRMGDPTPMILRSSPFSAEALMARMIDYVTQRVADRERDLPRHTVVTHPANWGPYKLELFDQALRLAGAESATGLTEPQAAAIAYANEERVPTGSAVAVYDLGGGTFDAAVLRKTGRGDGAGEETGAGFELLGESVGIEHLGGVDFDEAILHHVRERVGDRWPTDPDDPSLPAPMLHLRRACMEAKELLSSETEVAIPVLLPGVDTTVALRRRDFEAMIAPRLDDSISALEAAMASAGLRSGDLAAILLVGGSSRIPLVGDMLRNRFGPLVAVDVDPLYAVARGAALAVGGGTPAASPAPPPTTAQPVAAAVTEPAAAAPVVAATSVPAEPTEVIPLVAPVAAAATGFVAGSTATPVAAAPSGGVAPPTPPEPIAPPTPPEPDVWAAAAPTGAAPPPASPPTGAGPVVPPPGGPPPGGPPTEPVAAPFAPDGSPRSSRARLVIPVVVLVLIIGVLGAYFLTRSDGSGSGSADVASDTSAPAAAAAAAVLASGADMLAVPAGSYPLGVDKPESNSAETLLHTAEVAAFNIDRVEISNEAFKAFVDQTEASPPLSWPSGRYPADRAAHPVKGVTFEWAQAYCVSLGKQLPTETQWEVAARGADGRLYPWGNDVAAVQLPGPDTYPVGSVAGNASPFGVADLTGNVWEWVDEPYDKRVKENERVLRGGQNGWLRKNVTRLPVDPEASNATTIAGFRCAATTVDPARPALQFGEYQKPDPPVPPMDKPLPEGVLTDDDFRDATSGWVEKNTDALRYGYHPNEYFHLESKGPGQEVLAIGPVVPEPGRLISVRTSAFVEPSLTDGGGTFAYGVAFRVDGQGRGLVFVVSPRDSVWRICQRNADGTYSLIEQSNRQIPDVVNLEVRMTGPENYEFRIGEAVVHQRVIPGYSGSGTGLVLLSYAGSKKAHVHFDEFAIANRS